MKLVKIILSIILICLLGIVNAQFSSKVDYLSPKQYTIAGIVVDGVRNFDHNLIIQKSKLVRGKTLQIPGEEISNAIRNLWDENLFSDIKIHAEEILKTKKRLNEIYQKHTNISINEIEKAMERDRFFDPEEALKFGLIDKVITNREDK